MAGLKKNSYLGLVILLALGSCTPTVRLDTPEPVRIDVNMKVDVTSRDAEENKEKSGQNGKEEPVNLSPAQRQRNRMTEIQNLKNDRVVGEKNDGLLEMRRKPDDSTYASYARQLIENENNDRLELLKAEATESGRPLEVIRKDYANARRQSAFPGEWIQDPDGSWKQR